MGSKFPFLELTLFQKTQIWQLLPLKEYEVPLWSRSNAVELRQKVLIKEDADSTEREIAITMLNIAESSRIHAYII